MNILFMGRKRYAAELLEWTMKQGAHIVAVVTDSHFSHSPTALEAQRLGIPVISLEEAEQYMSEDASFADLVVSYLFWQKIKEPLISHPQYGCINFHPALLPQWRGTAGYNMAIMHKLQEWGATAHYVDENIDTGAIIRTYKFNFDYRYETAYSLEEKTQRIQQDLYKHVFTDIMEQGKLPAIAQQDEQGVYISRRQMEEAKRIDFTSDDIDLKIRAFWFPPYTGAFIEANGQRYTLVNDELLQQLARQGETAHVPKLD